MEWKKNTIFSPLSPWLFFLTHLYTLYLMIYLMSAVWVLKWPPMPSLSYSWPGSRLSSLCTEQITPPALQQPEYTHQINLNTTTSQHLSYLTDLNVRQFFFLILGCKNCGVIVSGTDWSLSEGSREDRIVEETKKDERPGEDNHPLLLAGGWHSSRGQHRSGRK